jgi:hypothetical protein
MTVPLAPWSRASLESARNRSEGGAWLWANCLSDALARWWHWGDGHASEASVARRIGLLDCLTKRAPFEVLEADQAAGDREEGLVNVGASLVADAEAAVLVQPGDRAFDYPTLLAEP